MTLRGMAKQTQTQLEGQQQGWATSPAEHASAVALIQIEAHLRSIRNMVLFFVVITVLGVLVGGITVVSVQQ